MYLGIDIGGTRIKAGLVDDQGRVFESRAVPTPTDPPLFDAALAGLCRELTAARGIPRGVGVGCKGVIDPESTEVEILPGPFSFLEGRRMASLIGPSLPQGVPIYVDNDARIALAGEIMWGAARGLSNAVMVTLGTGVGGGLLVEGKLVRGKRGAAGHLGHMTVDAMGPVCECGNRGLEMYFSARAIQAEALAAIRRGSAFRSAGDSGGLTCKDVFDAAAAGDETARAIVDRAIGYLAGALAGFAHAFDPERIILGGQISGAGDSLIGPLAHEVWKRSRRFLGREVPIVRQEVAGASGVVGAAALVRMCLENRTSG